MTENCTENHLIKAIEADDALTDELMLWSGTQNVRTMRTCVKLVMT